MVEVPVGKFLYGDDKQDESTEHSFLIDVYPVTNMQFKKFIDAGGYTDNDILQECWNEGGRKWRQKNNITKPKYWEDKIWNQADYPVVGVSYYEAEAYARWARKRLPTEKEWEKAARGTDGRKYPWKGRFSKEKCNSLESGIKETTRVDRYPNGISPYGGYDMAGNVWEWTSDWYDENKNSKVLRGGSWGDPSFKCRCAYHFDFDPDAKPNYVGFRCVRTKKT
jgi:formylglycine-generating enzyme required for sulfatase activity